MAPKIDDSWVKDFRSQLRSETASGWFVRPDNHGKARLVIQREGEKAQTAQIDAPWSKAGRGQILTIAMRLHAVMQERGLSLRAAIKALDESNTANATSWETAADDFLRMLTANIKPVSLEKYREVVELALEALASRRPPTTGYELVETVVGRWKSGTRRRQQAVQQLGRFLRYRVVDKGHLPQSWLLPEDTSSLVGQDLRPEQQQTPNKVTELRDDEILTLIDSFPDTDAGRRWADALRLMAELGIRPHELQFLSVKTDPRTGELYWHCSYQKRAGKTHRTKERRLVPLPIIGTSWNLMQRWQLGDIHLPPLGAGNGAGDAIRHYLMRRPVWKQLEALYAAEGNNIAPYSLRNSYSLRGASLGIPMPVLASMMGNTPEVLEGNYKWANDELTARMVANALAQREQVA